jgi:hypothetical protein
MLFDYDLLVPEATPEDQPVRKVCTLTSGILHEIRVKFPPGPATLVHVIILDSLHQIMPVNPEATINVDDETVISSNLKYKLRPPFEIFMDGWSPTATYEHTITAQFEVYPEDDDGFEAFRKLLEIDSKPIKR